VTSVEVAADPAVEARRAAQRARTDALRADFRHELGVAYGPHPKHVMDLYYPNMSSSTSAAPVLVFLHGGGFRNGSPSFNGYHGRPYLERGSLFVSMGYRLLPETQFPDSCDDVELGLVWLFNNIADRGGDPDRIYLSGHSAGAVLGAMVGLRDSPTANGLPPNLIKGLVLISGMYDFASRADSLYNRASARYVPHLAEAIQRLPSHTIVVGGDNDFPTVLPDARRLVESIHTRGGSAELFVEPDADHFAANRGFIQLDGNVALAVARMMQLP
jgi:arylformamidase